LQGASKITMSNKKNIIMNFGNPPGLDDLQVMAEELLDNLPDELQDYVEDLAVILENFPDDTVKLDLNVEDDYDLLGYYSCAKQLSPGIKKKEAEGEDTLILYRRPILDLWAEEEMDLSSLVRQIMIEEIGSHFEFSDEDIEDMIEIHHQGLL